MGKLISCSDRTQGRLQVEKLGHSELLAWLWAGWNGATGRRGISPLSPCGVVRAASRISGGEGTVLAKRLRSEA